MVKHKPCPIICVRYVSKTARRGGYSLALYVEDATKEYTIDDCTILCYSRGPFVLTKKSNNKAAALKLADNLKIHIRSEPDYYDQSWQIYYVMTEEEWKEEIDEENNGEA